MAKRSTISAAVVAAALIVCAPGVVFSQGREFSDLSARVERMQRDLDTLQRQVFQGRTPPASAGAAALPADARLHADLSVRLGQIENQLNIAQTRNEEMEHQLGEMRRRLDKLAADMERALAGQQQQQATAPMPSPAGAAPPGAAQPRPPLGGEPPQPAEGQGPGAPPRSLGTIPAGSVPDTPPPAQVAALPPGTPQQQYEYATSFLQKQDYSAAETLLKAFVASHAKDPLASSAQFWLGETYFVRRDYQNAAFAYAEGIEKYPQGNKAPDSLLKLGMSLARLGKNDQACTALSRLQGNFPGANETIKRRARDEQQRIKCRV
jgi:tol-pal system protein YbgF